MTANIKNLLQEILTLELNNGPLIYNLILNNNNLRKIINNIDNKKIISNSNPNVIIRPDMQVIFLLDRLINRFDDHFPLLHKYRTIIIDNFLRYKEYENYLKEKYYLGDNEYIKYYEEKLNLIFVKSFYNNFKYIENELTDIFKEYKINMKKISLDNPTELEKLLNILSDFSYCYHRWDSAYLFSEMDNDIKLNSEWKEEILKDYKFHLSRILENYNLKKEYLEIFKN